MRLIIAGGGTGGHLFPGLAVANALKDLDPEGSIMFVGVKHGIEARVIPGTRFPIRFINARGLKRTGPLNQIKGLVQIPLSILQSMLIIRNFKPDAVLGVGGYASASAVVGAWLSRVPRAIQEQNSTMGAANSLLSRISDRIFISWEGTTPRTDPKKTRLTGNPVRSDLIDEDAKPDANAADTLNILIFGGSAGAASLNKAMIRAAKELRSNASRISVRHQTGKVHKEEVRRAYEEAGLSAQVHEFIDAMGEAYDWADLVICRSGAGAMAEIAAKGKPAIVVPYPYAVGDHQRKNAMTLQKEGAVKIINDSELEGSALVDWILYLIDKPEELKAMAKSAKRLGRPMAAQEIAMELMELGRSRN